MLAFLADGKWPGELWDDDSAARAWTKNFRNGLNRNARFFKSRMIPHSPVFRALIAQEIANHKARCQCHGPAGPARSGDPPTYVDLLEPKSAIVLEDEGARLSETFADWIARSHQVTGRPAVIVLDQIDDVLRNAQTRDRVLARIGPLMAATAQRLPGSQGLNLRAAERNHFPASGRFDTIGFRVVSSRLRP